MIFIFMKLFNVKVKELKVKVTVSNRKGQESEAIETFSIESD